MRELLVCATLLLLAAPHAFGQENAARAPAQDGAGDASKEETPPFVRPGDARGEAARLLKSRENRERAWGAYLVGRHGLKGQAPLLVELLADPNLGGGWEEGIVRQAALDALIRLDADVDAEKLLPLYQSSPNEVIILLARSPQQNQQALLPLFVEGMPAAHWLAVSNLLAETRAPGFAARLLKDLKIEANVFVFDREGPHDIGTGGGYGGGCDYVRAFVPAGFPPVPHYALVAQPERGAVVVAPGRHPVYYCRTDQCDPCAGYRPAPPGERDFLRTDFLADLLNTSAEGLNFDARPWREVVCKDAAQCRRALAGARDEIGQSYSALLGRLLNESLLDPAEASELKPDITLDVTDYRDKKNFPLPDKLRGVKVSINEVDGPPCCADELPAPELTPPDRSGASASPELIKPDPPP